MKTHRQQFVAFAGMIVLSSTFQGHGIVGLGIERQCSDVVISWPSLGWEHFLIQHRTSLDPEVSWTTLTNNYPANSTNRTTFRIHGVAVPCSSGGGASLMFNKVVAPPVAMVAPKDGSKIPVPLGIYPPGIDLSGWTIIWPDDSTDDWSEELAEKWRASRQEETGLQSEDSGGSEPESHFFRGFLVPDFWYDYSQFTFSYGEEFMPIYLGVDGRLVSNVKLRVDGQVFPYATFDMQQWDFGSPGNPDVQWTYGMRFQSDRLTNGPHTLQLVTTLRLSGALNEHTPHLTLTSPAFTTTVDNPIDFRPWKSLMMGTNHTFKADTTIHPANWEINVWDAYGFWVTSATGTTTNGHISWTWDFYDDFGFLRDDVEYDPWFDPWLTIFPIEGGEQQGLQSGITRPAPLSSPDYPYNAGWIIAFQDNAKHVSAVRNAFIQMFFSLVGGPSQSDLATAAVLLKYGNTNDVDMTLDPVQNMVDRNASWDLLRHRLQQPLFRNLYVFSHGGGFSIGGDWEIFTNSPSGRQSAGTELGPNTYTVGTNQIRTAAYLTSGWCYRLRHPSTDNPRPYRFVFMDGCVTATGDWPYAFSMVAQTNNLSYFQAEGDRPNAFVGWNSTIGYAERLGATGGGWGDYQKFADFRTGWMFNWVFNGQTRGLSAALGLARQQSGWITSQRMEQIICIYGLNDIGFNDYNQRQFSFPE